MASLTFDIETVGFEGKQLDSLIREDLIKNTESEEEREGVLARTGLWPVSGEVVAIGMLNNESGKGRVYFQAPAQNFSSKNNEAGQEGIKDYEKDGVEYVVKDEKGILESFWEDIKFYQEFVTFNGRGFDCPFIVFRSIVHGIKPSRNLMPNRYYKNEHIDLADQLAFYGAFRKFTLQTMCQLFGIKNPKDEGVSGLAVNDLFKNKEYKQIAEYCMRDVVATGELYGKIKDFLSF